jgi:predicted AAA+ superfamily ATPase
MPKDWDGVLFEHVIHHELSAYLNYSRSRGTLGFWKTTSGSEIDFLWWYGEKCIGIEVKAAKDYRGDFLKGIRSFNENKKLSASYVVYRGKKDLKVDETWVLSAETFLKRLHTGEILGCSY